MITFENTEVVGWEAAIRGMRNPKNSWTNSDSMFKCLEDCGECLDCELVKDPLNCPMQIDHVFIGPNDHELMMKLRNAGTDHRKFMRMIVVYVDITAPLYWWKEFDTYKVGTVANSCSTMHKITAKRFEMSDFSTDHLLPPSFKTLGFTVKTLNEYRDMYLEEEADFNGRKDELTDEHKANFVKHHKELWWQLIQLLPSSYNQRRTVMMSYEVLANIYKSRASHKQDEWKEHPIVPTTDELIPIPKEYYGFCDWAGTLPYSELITGKWLEVQKT